MTAHGANVTLTKVLAEFLVQLGRQPRKIPPEVMEKARLLLFNGYGIGLACYGTPYAEVAARAALAIHGEQSNGATMLADGRKTSMLGAALANSALFHGRAQEDASGAAHLGGILIPLLTAAAETGHMPLDRLLPALIAGYEVGGLLESTYASHTTPFGLRSSTIYGALAAAASASVALDLNAEQTAAALANAASFAGGILQSFADGTDEWRYQLGMTAQNGWFAAELARAGSVSAPHAIEGKNGFVRAFAHVDCDVTALAAEVGKTWFIHRVVFKPYPVCAFNQTPVNAALQLREKLGSKVPKRIRVHMNPYETGYAGMDSKGPFHSVSGTLMSIPFCIANTLLHGAPTLRAMMVYDDPEVAVLIANTDLVSDPSVAVLSCVIEAALETGETITESLIMTAKNYNYSRPQLRTLIERVCAEVGVNAYACHELERFVDAPSSVGLSTVLSQFAQLRHHNAV